MIPTFPTFKSLAWQDRADVENLTNKFLPYSDFNFISMWSWNTREQMQIAMLNDNIVLLFYDYVTHTPFLTFIGNTDLSRTARQLLAYSNERLGEQALKLIPKDVAKQLPKSDFCVQADIDAHDYILSVEFLSSLMTQPNKYGIAYDCKRFFRLYPECTINNTTSLNVPVQDCIGLFKSWAKHRSLDHQELNEYSAFERYINTSEAGSNILMLYDTDKTIGFATFEILSCNYAICHFVKADQSYKGIYSALMYLLCKTLKENGVTYLNFEQDLGIPELRHSKQKLQPVSFFEKYTVSMKTLDR